MECLAIFDVVGLIRIRGMMFVNGYVLAEAEEIFDASHMILVPVRQESMGHCSSFGSED
jgi:glycogen synthase